MYGVIVDHFVDPVETPGVYLAVFDEMRYLRNNDDGLGSGQDFAASRLDQRYLSVQPIQALVAFEERIRFSCFKRFGDTFLDFTVAILELRNMAQCEVGIEFDFDTHNKESENGFSSAFSVANSRGLCKRLSL